jgi:hypothetical protein
MSQNAILLKRAMAYLELSGVALAKMITACREDGKTTAPETISRWLNGTNPVDPNVIGWMTELVRTKAVSLGQGLVHWPSRGSIMIAVANLKGGVGVTTLSHDLAFTAAETYGLKTLHIAVGRRSDTDKACVDLQRAGIEAQVMTYEEALAYCPVRRQVVIVDVARDAVYEALGKDEGAFLRRFSPDLILVPADFGSVFDVGSTKQFLEVEGLSTLIRLLHRPRSLAINFAATAAQAGFDVGSDSFCPMIMPQSVEYPPHLPARRRESWRSPDQQHHHAELFRYLVDQAGGHVSFPSEAERTLRALDLAGLLDVVTQDAQ